MYKEPKKYFAKFLIIALVSFIVIIASAGLSAAGAVGVIIALILVVINVFVLLAFTVISIIHFFKYLFNREKANDFIMHTVNMIMSIIVTALFLTFYFIIVAGALIILAPFL